MYRRRPSESSERHELTPGTQHSQRRNESDIDTSHQPQYFKMSEQCLHRLLQPRIKTSTGSPNAMRLRRLSQPILARQRKSPEALLRKRRYSLGQGERQERGGSDDTHNRRRRSATHLRCTLATLTLANLTLCQLPNDASSPSTTASSPMDFPDSFFGSSCSRERRRSSVRRGSPWRNLRRALSLITVSCWRELDSSEERRKEGRSRERKGNGPKRILRAPTRYSYHRGVSGLPVTRTIVPCAK
ncbi:hypothetical protein GWK47_038991 [Chionoecetes opilio]|uniref:DUF4797 domain-containing protein n=1 Tax=Chionoecetes opilio TaxID=41210 RepID=A0A8J5CXZ3_CHIOP|nr:hypothetical protein GWK47_038991 [Chionoecetes opilio]